MGRPIAESPPFFSNRSIPGFDLDALGSVLIREMIIGFIGAIDPSRMTDEIGDILTNSLSGASQPTLAKTHPNKPILSQSSK